MKLSLWQILKIDGQAQLAVFLFIIFWISAMWIGAENADTYQDSWLVSLAIGGLTTLICAPWFIWRVRRVRAVFERGVVIEGRVTHMLPGYPRSVTNMVFEYVHQNLIYRKTLPVGRNAARQYKPGSSIRLIVDPQQPKRVFVMDFLG